MGLAVLSRGCYVREAPWTSGPAVAARDHPFCTGDLVLTSSRKGRGRAVPPLHTSAAIKMMTRSHFNHVAVVVVDPDTRQPLFWEMNGAGTSLSALDDFMDARRDHDVFVRPINRAVDTVAFARAMAAQSRDRFNFAVPLDVVRGRWNRLVRTPTRCASEACARTCPHTAAEVYRLLGVLDYGRGRGIDPAALVPADFARDPVDPSVLPMADGFAFGPAMRLC